MKSHRSDIHVACDRQSARTIDEQGFLHVEACNISKACVSPYWGAEIPNWEELGLDPKKTYWLLRDPNELQKAASTFNNLPLMDNHIEVSADDLEDDKVKKRIVGSTGTDATFEYPYLKASLVVWTAGGIEGVMSKEQTQLSCAYRYELDMTPGEFEGQRYDARMFNLRGNHVALVDEGRAGPDVTVKDHQQMPQPDLKRAALGCSAAIQRAMAAVGVAFDEGVYKMPKSKAVAEHKRLIKALITPSKVDDAEEIIEQSGDLEEAEALEDSDILTDVIREQPGHKDAKGNPAPWTIVSEKTGNVIWSGGSKSEAESALGRIHSFATDSITRDIRSDSVTADFREQ